MIFASQLNISHFETLEKCTNALTDAGNIVVNIKCLRLYDEKISARVAVPA